MKLSKEDVALFYKLHSPLLFYTNQQLQVIKDVSTMESFLSLPLQEILKIRDSLYERLDLIDSFVKQNPFHFSEDELNILLSWKNLVKGTFYLMRILKNYAIFLIPEPTPKAYGVLALKNSFDEILGSHFPIMLITVLLPFKNQIIYDGLMSPYNITFGGGIRRRMNDTYQEAKTRFGIITSLPFVEEKKESDTDKLKFYLKSERNREQYWEEIQKFIRRDENLLVLYHQEMGRIHARDYGKRLRETGIRESWFAILQGIIVASGITKDETEHMAFKLVPSEKKKFVYLFHFKG